MRKPFHFWDLILKLRLSPLLFLSVNSFEFVEVEFIEIPKDFEVLLGSASLSEHPDEGLTLFSVYVLEKPFGKSS